MKSKSNCLSNFFFILFDIPLFELLCQLFVNSCFVVFHSFLPLCPFETCSSLDNIDKSKIADFSGEEVDYKLRDVEDLEINVGVCSESIDRFFDIHFNHNVRTEELSSFFVRG